MQAIFKQITADIIAAIEAGTEQYVMPWHRTSAGVPTNALTNRTYRASNVLALWAAAASKGFTSNRWGTYRQWGQLGGQVRKAERGTVIVFWKVSDSSDGSDRDDDGTGYRRFVARAARVFNADQVDSALVAASPDPLDPSNKIASAQVFIDKLPAVISYGGDHAFYDLKSDAITLPPFTAFRSAASFYSVLAHELTHWTGPKHRLDRDLSGRFGSSAYAIEELIAELGASFLCAQLGIGTEPRRDHAPYLANWLAVLRADPRALVSAANQAQAAVDFLVDLSERPVSAADVTKTEAA